MNKINPFLMNDGSSNSLPMPDKDDGTGVRRPLRHRGLVSAIPSDRTAQRSSGPDVESEPGSGRRAEAGATPNTGRGSRSEARGPSSESNAPKIPEGVADGPIVVTTAPGMSFKEACYSLKRHLLHDTFRGRASRSEYWYGWLIMVIIGFVTGRLYHFVASTGIVSLKLVIGLTLAVIMIGAAFEELGLRTRRAHDANMSGWWVGSSVILSVIPIPLIMYGMYKAAFLGVSLAGALGTFLGTFLIAGVALIVSLILWLLIALAKPDHRGAKYDKRVSPDKEE